MQNLYLLIGEHIIQVKTNHQHIYQWLNEQYDSWLVPKGSQIDLQVVIEQSDGIPTTDYKVNVLFDDDHMIFQRSDYWLKLSLDYQHARIGVLNQLALKHALMCLYSSFIAYHSWGLLIHSSCVEDKGRAFLFAGPSGAGKSTVAKLSAPRSLLSDEATLLKIHPQGIVTVFDSPFRSEFTVPHPARTCPLSGIHILVQSNDVKMIPLQRAEALFQLFDKIFYWPSISSETLKVLHLGKRLVEAVPVHLLHFQKKNTFWELIS